MADPAAKTPENVSGKFYVDDSCSACMVCCDTAPDNFKMTDDESHAFVCKQPAGDELDKVKEAMDGCPEGAIGDDG
ncbi:MAG: ferredoxin [Planctomycetes bacterium]|jgi:ferredoxin|nr:ferredoxin [Planctomycetota bacterium]